MMMYLQPFAKHLFVSRWQLTQFKVVQSSLPSSANARKGYNPRTGYNHVTMHTIILHYRCLGCSSQVTDYFVFFSDDLLHDACMINVILKQTVEHLLHVGV